MSDPRPQNPLLILQSSLAQSSLPLLRTLISTASRPQTRTLLFCLLHPPSTLFNVKHVEDDRIRAYDFTACAPGYYECHTDVREEMLTALKDAPSGPLSVVIDSVDTLHADIDSTSRTYHFVRDLFSLIRSRQSPSRLTLHILAPSPLLPLLVSPALSSPLTQVIAHPPALLTHIASAYLTPPPPASPSPKFWGVFLPVSERSGESAKLVYGRDGDGSGSPDGEIVLEVLVRKRGVERVLEGWARGQPCDLAALHSLKSVWGRKAPAEDAPPDPTQNVSFNLNLTPAQLASRAQVPLPYAHEGMLTYPSTCAQLTFLSGKPIEKPSGAIFYDPDSADDIDDDDPDEDLDI
ncbi:hypothetical protein PLICRDRAFT_152336 [Plicaturopsis crispa FD-325 SS-3]|nr:hypothetical protein PLICRDRAFT_152336 [Plicaturopsis crispa FD-325 SS-3]